MACYDDVLAKLRSLMGASEAGEIVALAQKPRLARDYHLGSISLGVYELAFPPAATQQLRVNLIKRCREDRLQQLVSSNPLSDHILCRPPVELFGRMVPVGDDIIHVAHENAVMREIEETGLLPLNGLRLERCFRLASGF